MASEILVKSQDILIKYLIIHYFSSIINGSVKKLQEMGKVDNSIRQL